LDPSTLEQERTAFLHDVENNNQLVQCHMPNKTESLENSCENFSFAKKPRGLQEQNCVFREFIYIRRQEFTSYVKNQSK